MQGLQLHVTYIVNGTVQKPHIFTCENVTSRTIGPHATTIQFTNGRHVDADNRPISNAQYRTCEVILSYIDEG